MFKRDYGLRTRDYDNEGVDPTVLLCGAVRLVRVVCDSAAGRCDGCAGLPGYAKRGVEVFHHRVFAGAVQSVDKACGIHRV